jgi:hypothetical protein
MSEYEQAPQPRLVGEGDSPDWRRLEVAQTKFAERIGAGIAEATAGGHEVDADTALCIAHVLGRALGRDSALAAFGRTGGGEYIELRDEYLRLYGDPSATARSKEWIDWLGTYLVQRENLGSGRRFLNEHLPPSLDRLLVRTRLHLGGHWFDAHLPADWDRPRIDDLERRLSELGVAADDSLQAFLSLPDVNAAADNLIETFHETFAGSYPDLEGALRALSPFEEWEMELSDWCLEHGIEGEAVQWNLTPLIERLRTIYDLVELKGTVYVFVS